MLLNDQRHFLFYTQVMHFCTMKAVLSQESLISEIMLLRPDSLLIYEMHILSFLGYVLNHCSQRWLTWAGISKMMMILFF